MKYIIKSYISYGYKSLNIPYDSIIGLIHGNFNGTRIGKEKLAIEYIIKETNQHKIEIIGEFEKARFEVSSFFGFNKKNVIALYKFESEYSKKEIEWLIKNKERLSK